MKYFENLPIIDINDKQFRNLFQKVVIDTIEDNELINYRIKDYETLNSISYDLYGTVDYWWVIALLNNIQDISFDIPLNNEQIETIANDLATEYTFSNSILTSGSFDLTIGTIISEGITIKEISFRNDDKQDYFVIITPIIDDLNDIENLGEYGYRKINPTTFQFIVGSSPNTQQFTYAVFAKPKEQSIVNTSNFVKYYNALLNESDVKRNIRLIKSGNLNHFLTSFLTAIKQKTQTTSKISYKNKDNYLKKYTANEIPNNGVFVENGENTVLSDKKFVELDITNHDVNNHIYIMSRPNNSDIGSTGALGVKHIDLIPKVYRTGEANSEFDYLVLSPSNSKFSSKDEIIKSGIGTFVGNGNNYLISINDKRIETIDDIGLMITPIADTEEALSNVGNFGFTPIDKRTIYVRNTGNNGIRFFWSVYQNNLIVDQLTLSGHGGETIVNTNKAITDYNTLTPLIAINTTPITSYKQQRLSEIGAFGFKTSVNKDKFTIINTGEATMPFVYKILDGFDTAYIQPNENGTEINISSYSSIRVKEDINLYVIYAPNNDEELKTAGEIGIRLINKNTIRIYSGGNCRLRYHLITEWLEQGINNFSGKNNYTEISLSNHDEINYDNDVCLCITPIYDNDLEINNVGEFDYQVIDKNTVRVYNTGKADIRFKWCLVKADKNE